MGAIQETSGDFDGDGDITGKDLDIMWAYIQTKALAQAEWDANLLKEDDDATKCLDLPSKCSPVDPVTGEITPLNKCNKDTWMLSLSHPGVPDVGDTCPPCCNYLPTNFITKMLDLYEANQDAGLAEDVTGTSNTLSDTPGTYELGKPTKQKQFKILQYWKLNEVPQAKDKSGSAHMADDEVIESVYGKIESNATIGNVTRVTTNNTQNLIEFDDSAAKLKLNDKSLVSTKDWTLIIKGKTRDLSNGEGFFKVFHKGLFSLQIGGKLNMALVTDSNAEKIDGGAQQNTNVLYYDYEISDTPWNKDVTIYLVKRGFILKLIVDNGVTIQEYPTRLAAHHSNIGVSEKSEKLPLIIHGEVFSSLKYVQVIDDSLTTDKIKGFQKNHEIDEYIYKHSLSVSDLGSFTAGNGTDASLDCFIGFATQIMDDFNNPLKLHHVKYKETNGLTTPTGIIRPVNAGDHTSVFRDNITGGMANGFSYSGRDTVLALGHQDGNRTRMAMLDGLTMKSNFTISFWFRTSIKHNNTFLRFQSSKRDIRDIDDNNRTDRVDIMLHNQGKKINVHQVINDQVKVKNLIDNGTTDMNFQDNWHHLTFVKNGDLLGVWMNKIFKGFASFTNQEQDDLDRVVMSLSGNGQLWSTANNSNKFADLRVLGYAMSNVPANNLVTHDYSFIDKLKS